MREDCLLVSDIFNPNPQGKSVSVLAEDPRRTTQLSADACAEQPRNSSEKVKYAMKHEMKLIVWIGIFATAALGKHMHMYTIEYHLSQHKNT